MVKQLKEININIEKKEFKLVDGRSIDRFEGKVEVSFAKVLIITSCILPSVTY